MFYSMTAITYITRSASSLAQHIYIYLTFLGDPENRRHHMMRKRNITLSSAWLLWIHASSAMTPLLLHHVRTLYIINALPWQSREYLWRGRDSLSWQSEPRPVYLSVQDTIFRRWRLSSYACLAQHFCKHALQIVVSLILRDKVTHSSLWWNMRPFHVKLESRACLRRNKPSWLKLYAVMIQ